MQDNRYAPTQGALNSQQAVEPSEHALEPASRSRRFLNSLIDTVASILVAFVVGTVLAILWPQLITALSGPRETSMGRNYFVGMIIGLIYYLPLEASTGRTLGKLITGTKVISTTGAPLTFPQVLGRTLARYIPLEGFTFLSSSRVGLHDKVSNTRVVSSRPTAST